MALDKIDGSDLDFEGQNFYRTGSFTPVYSSDSATDLSASITTGTYQAQHGVYVRIGDMVHVQCHLKAPTTWTYTNGGAINQNLTVAGLPFTTASSNGGSEQWSATVGFINNVDWTTSYSMVGLFHNNSDRLKLYYFAATTAPRVGTNVFDKAGSTLYFSGTYRTEDA